GGVSAAGAGGGPHAVANRYWHAGAMAVLVTSSGGCAGRVSAGREATRRRALRVGWSVLAPRPAEVAYPRATLRPPGTLGILSALAGVRLDQSLMLTGCLRPSFRGPWRPRGQCGRARGRRPRPGQRPG